VHREELEEIARAAGALNGKAERTEIRIGVRAIHVHGIE
jgi:hypothetical protein